MCGRENYNIHAHYLRYLKNKFESPTWLTIHHLGRWPYSGRKSLWSISLISSRVVNLSSDSWQVSLVFRNSHTLTLWGSYSQKESPVAHFEWSWLYHGKTKILLKIKSKTKIGRGRFEIKAWAISDLFWANGLRSKSPSLICFRVSSQELQNGCPILKPKLPLFFFFSIQRAHVTQNPKICCSSFRTKRDHQPNKKP